MINFHREFSMAGDDRAYVVNNKLAARFYRTC